MPHGKVIFNKKGRWDWLDRGCDIGEDELNQGEWFVGDMFYPPDYEYDTSMHDHQITAWLSKPDELVPFKKRE
ncbi:hypothetical protein JYY74_004260 [Salmonella enterica subsp. enterica serovar Enteritidis]|nr:hypothetical protein [Salmonella enterica subsp. enterica serovar Enteritidis]